MCKNMLVAGRVLRQACSLTTLSSTGTGGRTHTAHTATQRPARSYDREPTSPLRSTQRAHHAAATRALSTARTPDTARVAAHTPPQQRPQPQGSTTREHATLHDARTARARIAPPPDAEPPNSRRQTPRTNDDARKRKDAACPHGHKAEDADRWGTQKTWSSPRQRGPIARAGRLLFPPMRAWLEQPRGRRHKAPPQPCALPTTILAIDRDYPPDCTHLSKWRPATGQVGQPLLPPCRASCSIAPGRYIISVWAERAK